MICPKCGKDTLAENSLHDQVLCLTCRGEFKLTPVNSWYQGTALAKRDIEYSISV